VGQHGEAHDGAKAVECVSQNGTETRHGCRSRGVLRDFLDRRRPGVSARSIFFNNIEYRLNYIVRVRSLIPGYSGNDTILPYSRRATGKSLGLYPYLLR